MAVMAEEERPDSQGPGGVEVQATPPSPPNRPSSSASAANGSRPKSSSSTTSSSSSSSEDPAPAASSQVPVDSQVQGEENVEEPQPKRTKFQPSGCVKLHLGVLIIQVLSRNQIFIYVGVVHVFFGCLVILKNCICFFCPI